MFSLVFEVSCYFYSGSKENEKGIEETGHRDKVLAGGCRESLQMTNENSDHFLVLHFF